MGLKKCVHDELGVLGEGMKLAIMQQRTCKWSDLNSSITDLKGYPILDDMPLELRYLYYVTS